MSLYRNPNIIKGELREVLSSFRSHAGVSEDYVIRLSLELYLEDSGITIEGKDILSRLDRVVRSAFINRETYTLSEICDRFKTTPQTTQNRLKRAGILPVVRGRYPRNLVNAYIKERRIGSESYTPREVAELLGLSKKATYERLSRNGIRSLGPNKYPKDEIDAYLSSLKNNADGVDVKAEDGSAGEECQT